jgi:hypothetical protein
VTTSTPIRPPSRNTVLKVNLLQSELNDLKLQKAKDEKVRLDQLKIQSTTSRRTAHVLEEMLQTTQQENTHLKDHVQDLGEKNTKQLHYYDTHLQVKDLELSIATTKLHAVTRKLIHYKRATHAQLLKLETDLLQLHIEHKAYDEKNCVRIDELERVVGERDQELVEKNQRITRLFKASRLLKDQQATQASTHNVKIAQLRRQVSDREKVLKRSVNQLQGSGDTNTNTNNSGDETKAQLAAAETRIAALLKEQETLLARVQEIKTTQTPSGGTYALKRELEATKAQLRDASALQKERDSAKAELNAALQRIDALEQGKDQELAKANEMVKQSEAKAEQLKLVLKRQNEMMDELAAISSRSPKSPRKTSVVISPRSPGRKSITTIDGDTKFHDSLPKIENGKLRSRNSFSEEKKSSGSAGSYNLKHW